MPTFTPTRVPGLLDDGAYQEQLKQFGKQQADIANPLPPSSAVDMADKVSKDFFVNLRPLPAGGGIDLSNPPPVRPAAGLGSFVGALTGGNGMESGPGVQGGLGALEELGTYSAEDSAAASATRLEDAKTSQKAIDNKAMIRAKLRGMSDADAEQLGLPIQPGGGRDLGQIEQLGVAATIDAKRQAEAADAVKTAENVPVKQTWWLSAMQNGAREFARVGISVGRWPVIATEGLRDYALQSIGPYGADDTGKTDLHVTLDNIEKHLTEMLPGDKARAQDFVQKLSGGVGSFMAFLTAGYVSTAAKVPVVLGTAALGAAVEGDATYQEAEQFNATMWQKYAAFIAGSALGLTEAVPIDRMFMRADHATGGALRRFLTTASHGSLEEFIQEFGQSIGEDVIAKYMAAYDEKRNIDIAKAVEQGFIGGITGGLGGGAVQMVHEAAGIDDSQLKPEKPVEAPQEGTDAPPPPTPAQQHEDAVAQVFDDVQVEFSTIPGIEQELADVQHPSIETTQAAPNINDGRPAAQPAGAVAAPSARVNTPAGAARLEVAIAEDGLPQLSVVPDKPNIEYRGGTPPGPLNEAGLVELTHWSRTARETLDPQQMGTGPYRGQERQRLAGSNLGRIYYGINARADMTAKERRAIPYDEQRKMGYVREPGLGNARHTVLVDPNDLYNWYEDPQNLKAGLDRELAPSEQITQFEDLIKKAGFKGYWIDNGPQGQTAALFSKMQPAAITDERTGQPIQPEPSADEAAMLTPEVADRLMDQVPGFAAVLPYLTDEEQARVAKRGAAQKLVDIFGSLPDAHEMAAAAVAGSAKRGWYKRSAKALIDIFGLNDAPRFAGLLAALSPQTSVETNTVNAINMWAAWLKAGRPTDPKAIKKLMAKSIGMGSMSSVLDSWINNTVRALSTKDALGIKLSGPKVSSFMKNLQGATNEVTNDTWMANFANIDQSIFKATYVKDPQTGEQIGVKSPGYLAMSVLVRKAANAATQMTGDEWTASEIQETVWSWTKALVEKTNIGRSNRPDPNAQQSFEEIVATLGLTAEDINATPDFATLFVGGIYRTLLEKGGYGDAIAEVAKGSDGADGRAAGGPDAQTQEATASTSGDLAGHLTRAARRLDDLRARRLGLAEGVDAVPFYQSTPLVPETPQLSPEELDDFLAQVAPDDADLRPLGGLPAGSAGPIASVVHAARAYAASRGLPLRRQAEYVKVDEARARRIAQAYDKMEHAPEDPKVKKAYEALIEETLAQFQFVKQTGLQIEFIQPKFVPLPDAPEDVNVDARSYLPGYKPAVRIGTDTYIGSSHVDATDQAVAKHGSNIINVIDKNPDAYIGFMRDTADPYPEGPKQVLDDLARGHLWVFPTDQGFGTLTEIQDNPLLAPVDEVVDGRQLVANDVFRIVHDFFGHGLEGSGFGARGEENAWQSHMRLFSPAAIPAMTSETRGQNSWVNFGPHGEANRANQRETIYADQKVGLMPSWTWTEGVEDNPDFATEKDAIEKHKEFVLAADEAQDATWEAMTDRRPLTPAENRLNELIATEYQYEPGSPEAQARDAEMVQLREQVQTERNQREAAKAPGNTGTAAGRTPFKAEQTRKPTADTGQGKQDVRLAQIAQNFIALLRLTVRQGRLGIKGSNVMGVYSRKQATVRLRSWNDLSTLVHEGGHALHDSMAGALAAFTQRNAAPLMKVADDLYGRGVLDTAGLNKDSHVREGFAEFFRVYVLNKAFANRQYGPLTAEFDAILGRDAPDIARGLELMGVQFETYLNAPSTQVLSSLIVPGIREEGMRAAMTELRAKGFKSWFQERARRTVMTLVNKYEPLNRTVSGLLNLAETNTGKPLDLKRAEDPRVLARLAPNSGSRGMIEVVDGVMPYKSTQPATKGLRDALLRAHGLPLDRTPRAFDETVMQDFSTYVAGLRILDEYRRFEEGKLARPPVGLSKGDVAQAVTDLTKKYGKNFTDAAEMVNDYSNALWDKTHAAGLMSDETHDKGLDRRFYVPLQRDMGDKKRDFAPNAVTGGRSIVKTFRGSDRAIIDPIAVLMHKTFALEATIAANDVAKALAVLADKAGKAGALVERIPAKVLKGMTISVEDAARQLTKDETMTEADAHDLMLILSSAIKDGNAIKLFRSEQVSTLGENVVFYWENGQIAALQLTDGEVGQDLMAMFNGVGAENMGAGVELLAGSTTVFRAAITSWPDFLLVNFIRDQMSSWILNDVGFKPFVTGIKGVWEELRQRGWAKQANASMMSMGGQNVAALHDARTARDVNALRAKGYLPKIFADRTPLGIAKGMARITELTETGTRLGLYELMFKRAKGDGLTDYEAAVEAGYGATDTMDFGLHGSRTALVRRTVPFLGAWINGWYKMMRTLGADEVRQRKGLKFVLGAYFKNVNNLPLSRTEKQAVRTGRKAWIKMTGISMISAALWAMFRDDDDYQEVSEYLRMTNWIIPMGNGTIVAIPKPFELALMANATERGLEFAAGDPSAPGRFLRGVAMTALPPTSPPAIQLAVEQAFNVDAFTGQPIVPDYMQALSPELQYNNYSSELAKWAGNTFGWSPMVVDHWLAGMGASAYRDMAAMTNALNPNRPSMDAADTPILRRFVRDVHRGSASAADFWAIASQRDGSMTRAALTYKTYMEAGNAPAANRFLQSLKDDEKAYAILNTHFKAEAKRLNPFYRARQVTTVISAMRRELGSDLSLESTDEFADTPTIRMGATMKRQVDTLLSEYARREVRNTLVSTSTPGWAGKQFMKTETTLDILRHVAPTVAEELDRRMAKSKVYPAELVNASWPEVRSRLLVDREEAVLDDLVEEAKSAL